MGRQQAKAFANEETWTKAPNALYQKLFSVLSRTLHLPLGWGASLAGLAQLNLGRIPLNQSQSKGN